mmetsp:Transcript_35602/g.67149  ORF Transcript_35602/g.67149 Transcript_35602/m.67149 type:complete len:451 (+) Transcript_35602:262-1614(+)
MASPAFPWDTPLQGHLQADSVRVKCKHQVHSVSASVASSENKVEGGSSGTRRTTGDMRNRSSKVASATSGRPLPPKDHDEATNSTGLENRARPRRHVPAPSLDPPPQAPPSSSSYPTYIGRDELHVQPPKPEATGGDEWFVHQQSMLESDMRKLQTNAEAARAEAARQARQREASVAERERRRNIERTHLEKEKAQLAHEQDMLYEEQARFDAQLRAEAEHMMKQADNRQRTPPVSTARNAPPKTESCSTTYSSSGGFMKNLTGLFGFSGSTASAAASAAAAASVSRSVGQPPASAKSQSYTNEGADQDFQRRRAEAEHRRRRDQEQQSKQKQQCFTAHNPPKMTVDTSAWEKHERVMTKFENNPPGAIHFDTVPWPPDPEEMLRMMIKLEGSAAGAEKRIYRKLTMRWHPDKFQNRYGSGLAAADHERILNRVKDISQILNRAWDSKEF